MFFPLSDLLFLHTGKAVADAAEMCLRYMQDRVHGAGGVIVVSPSGEWVAKFTTERMAWAAVEDDVLWYGLDPDENFKEQLFQ